MANRVLFGARGAELGLWISKPGVNVLTAADSGLLFKASMRAAQIIQYGRIAQPGGAFINTAVNIPNLGYRPIIEHESVGWPAVVFQWVSATQIVFMQAPNLPDGSLGNPFGNGTVDGAPSQRFVYYRVWSLPCE
jgi:hypothetical protein